MENRSEQTCRWSSRPQYAAILTAAIFLLSAGMNLALSVGWFKNSVFGPLQHFCYSWFIGVIIGAIASVLLSRKFSKKTLRAICCALILVNGIIFTSAPTTNGFLLAARYLNGIAVGLNTVPFIMYATEVADDSHRGSCLGLEQCCISLGMAIQIIVTSYLSSDVLFPANRIHGIFDLIFGLSGWISLRYYVESPMAHISKGDKTAALESLAKLHRSTEVNEKTEFMLQQRLSYVEEQESLSAKESLVRSLLPLIKILFYRSLILALSNSLALNLSFAESMEANAVNWAPVAAAFCRIGGSLISLVMADLFERKLFSILYGISLGVSCLYLGAYFIALPETGKYFYMSLQFFVGLYAPYTTAFMTEAFPLRMKAIMMSVCVVVEQILQIIFICTLPESLGMTILVYGGISLGVVLISVFILPKTKNTTLSGALEKFRKPFHANIHKG